jgi:(R)-2-hydroxyacyl-CoA dehydratese activating ATPase
MNNGKVLAGIDAGHVNTKAVIMRGKEILGYGTAPTAFRVAEAARAALDHARNKAGIPPDRISGIVTTGIFRDAVKDQAMDIKTTIPEYVADAKGAFFLNGNSRTVIDIGGNIHKAMHFDRNGDLIDVIQNDKCADGLGIFYTGMAKAMGLSEQELSDLAMKSTGDVSVAIQCALAAESEAIDLMCRGVGMADVANAVSRFMGERVAAMCTYMPLTKEVVVAGGLAKSQALIKHLSALIKEEIGVVDLPEYLGAIGAVITYGGDE